MKVKKPTFPQPFYNETNMVLSRLELETYSYQKYTLPIKLKNPVPPNFPKSRSLTTLL
jgi:hypothetical protein